MKSALIITIAVCAVSLAEAKPASQTKEEYVAEIKILNEKKGKPFNPNRARAFFDQADKNKDGLLSQNEKMAERKIAQAQKANNAPTKPAPKAAVKPQSGWEQLKNFIAQKKADKQKKATTNPPAKKVTAPVTQTHKTSRHGLTKKEYIQTIKKKAKSKGLKFNWEKAAQRFLELDTNHDKRVTKREIEAYKTNKK